MFAEILWKDSLSSSRVRILSIFPSNIPSILPWTYNYVLPLFRPHAPEAKTEGVCIISTLSVYLVNNPLTPLWRQPLKHLSHLLTSLKIKSSFLSIANLNNSSITSSLSPLFDSFWIFQLISLVIILTWHTNHEIRKNVHCHFPFTFSAKCRNMSDWMFISHSGDLVTSPRSVTQMSSI